MCTEQLPPGGYPIAFKYIITYQYIEQHKNWEECGPCFVFAGFTLAFALQLRKKHGKPSVEDLVVSPSTLGS
jgi:hypothetical protein